MSALFRLLLISVLSCSHSSSAKASCESGSLAKLLGVCEAARVAGKEAAEEIVRGINKSVLDSREMFNQFGALAGDIHDSTNPQRQARARAIFRGILGENFDGVKAPALEYSVQLVGPREVSLEIDSYAFLSDDNSSVAALFSNNRAAFNPQRLNAAPVASLTNEVVRKRLKEAAFKYHDPKEVAGRRNACDEHLRGKTQRYDAQMIECQATLSAYILEEVVLSVFDVPGPLPVSDRHVRGAYGGFVALLAKRSELQRLSQLPEKTFLHFWVHVSDKPDTPIKNFMIGSTNAVNKQILQLSEWLNEDKCIKSTKPHGDVCFLWVPLRLEAVNGYLSQREDPLAKK